MAARIKPALALALRLAAAAAAVSAVYVLWLPDVAPLKKSNPTTTSYIELRRRQAGRDGRRFHLRMYWVGLDKISGHLQRAVLTAEDDQFYRHEGVDWEATRAAFEKDWRKKRLAHGGSTITQQLARNLYLSPSKNPLRKVKELLIAWRLERRLGKRRILELYLNVAEWGRGIYGAEAAARAYFGKRASELGVEEAAALAVVLPNPRRLNPAKKTRYVERNSRRILARMKRSGYLPPEADEDQLDRDFEALLSTATATSPAWGPAPPFPPP